MFVETLIDYINKHFPKFFATQSAYNNAICVESSFKLIRLMFESINRPPRPFEFYLNLQDPSLLLQINKIISENLF